MLWLVLVLACAAAFAFALSAMLQQREAAQLKGDHALGTVHGFSGFLRSLVRRRVWLAGFLINNLGFLIQAAALHLGSVAVVQPVMVSQVLFALLLTGVGSRMRPTRRDWGYVLCICAGLIVLLSVSGAAPLRGAPDRDQAALVLLVMAACVVALVAVARVRSGRTSSLLLAIAAGMCFAASAVLIKLTTADLFGPGVLHTALDWPGYCLALSTAGGLVIEQAAFAGGTLPWAVAAMSITNPVASYLAGIVGFHVTPPHTAGALAAVCVTAVLVGVGISGLAHSPLSRSETPRKAQVAVS
ncbi:DMT family transporter [Flexivirga sp. ID2601S]|uniref:DMT family transporter n=1 Tax=Flexivirga aerilata TaxID=1656889 RepID=A0A849AGY1_9MICO|nr:DMT family transporter [Flexivirga aerilata]NNG38468.1 DMT family transporter [Flexivirga aerilata]